MPLSPEYHPEAREELQEQGAFYRREDRELAQRFRDAIRKANERIVSAPYRFPPYLYGTRRLLLPRPWPFGVVYLPPAEEGELPVVIAVAHNRRRPGYWRYRLPEAS